VVEILANSGIMAESRSPGLRIVSRSWLTKAYSYGELCLYECRSMMKECWATCLSWSRHCHRPNGFRTLKLQEKGDELPCPVIFVQPYDWYKGQRSHLPSHGGILYWRPNEHSGLSVYVGLDH